jgi:CRP/FNR family transcriptional regulator, cyclic AMP receptor protein
MNIERYTNLAFFSNLSPAETQLLAPIITTKTWVAGTVVFEQGDGAEFLYLVVSGEVTIRYKPDDGPVMNLTRITRGGVCGWSAAMGNPTYTSGALCTLDSEVLCIRGSDLRLLCEKHPQLGKVILDRLSAIIAQRQQGQQEQVNSMLASGMRQQTSN